MQQPARPLGLVWLEQINAGKTTLAKLSEAWASEVDVAAAIAAALRRFPQSANHSTSP